MVPTLQLDISDNAPIRNSYVNVTGSDYLLLTQSGNTAHISFVFEGDPAVDWVVQALPGQSGEAAIVVTNDETVDFGGQRDLLLIVTALPRDTYDPQDPETASETYHYRLSMGR